MTPLDIAIYNSDWKNICDMLGLSRTVEKLGDLLAAAAGSQSFAAPVADLAELRLVGPADRADKQVRLSEAEGALFRFDTTGTGDDDNINTIVPTDIIPPALGRWFRTTSSPKFVYGTLVWNPPPLAVGEMINSGDITVFSAAVGDTVIVSAPYALPNVFTQGYVTNSGIVQFDLYNMGNAIDLPNGTWRITVIKNST